MRQVREWRSALGALAIFLGGGVCLAQPSWGATCSSVLPCRATDIRGESLQARLQLIGALEELAEWCTKEKIYAKRMAVYRSILHFDSESAVARRGLGFVRNSAGEWVEKPRRVEPRDWDKAAAREFSTRRSAVAEDYRKTMLGLLETHAERITPAEMERILDDLLFADPDDPRVHELRGEVSSDGKWVLAQTVGAKKRRAEMRNMVRQAFKGVPKAEEVLPNWREEQFGIGWKAVYATPIVRSLGTGTPEEVKRMTQAMAATHSYFNAVLSVEAKFPEDFTVFTLARPSDKMAFLMNHPVVEQAYRDFLFKLDGSGIQGSGDLAHWSDQPTRRLDGLVRQAIGWLLAESLGIYPKHGWVFEGLGIYLTRELVGTRLTWYVRPSEYLVEADDNALKQRLLDTRTNWMNEAAKVLADEGRPSLALLLGRDVNQLTTEDLLYSYALVAYLLEGESEKFPAILARIGSGDSSVSALEGELGVDLKGIDERVIRWLNERR